MNEQTPDRKRFSALMYTVLGIIVLLIARGALESGSGPYLPQGTVAPDWRFEKYGGGTVSLEELRGKVVMLDFWATWCPPCIEEMPSLVKLAKEYEPKGLVFVAASRDERPNHKAAVGVFIARRAQDLAPYAAFADDTTTLKYKVVSLPTLYFIDREGKVREARSGYATEGQLRKSIEAALQ